jgi:ligand-binding SRPBCC domain-containing protein
MTVLENSIRIDAPPEKVWAVLTSLEALQNYDPGVTRSEIISVAREGIGAARECHLAPGGSFKERVAEWLPGEALAFELFECTLPVKTLRHRYTFAAEEGGTRVRQRMEYELNMGALGWLLDALFVRRRWDAGIKGFFSGLKRYVETGGAPPAKAA